jgi:hypothetical protein
MTSEATGDEAAREQAYAALVHALLAARPDSATERFDRELDDAVRRGAVTAEVARRLHGWQRASVQAVADHARGVLPAALAALDGSREDLAETVAALTAVLGDGADHNDAGDTPGPTSTNATAAPSSLEERRERMIVADLVTAPYDVHTDNR